MHDFDYLYKTYSSYIRNIVASMIKDDPEDIVQITFYRLSKCERITNEAHAKAFLITVCKNLSRDYIKARSRERNNFKTMASDLRLESEPTTEEDTLALESEEVRSIVLALIYEEIKKLPPATRRCFELYCFDNKGQKEIAELLGVTVSTVNNLLHYAKKKLKIKILFDKKIPSRVS